MNIWEKLPDLVLLEEYQGNWDAYLDALYQGFALDFIIDKPVFQGKRLGLKRYPVILDKEATFWHMISSGEIEAWLQVPERFAATARGTKIPVTLTATGQTITSTSLIIVPEAEIGTRILQMVAINNEVTENIHNLALSVQETTTAIEEMTFSVKEALLLGVAQREASTSGRPRRLRRSRKRSDGPTERAKRSRFGVRRSRGGFAQPPKIERLGQGTLLLG